MVGIYFGVISAAALIKFGEVPSSIWLAPLLFSLVLGTLVMSLAFLWSAVFKGPLASTITVLFSLVALPIVDMILAVQRIETWFTPYSAVSNVTRVLALLDRDLLFGQNAAMTFPVAASLLVVGAYIVGFSVVSIYLFKRRDM